MPNFISLCMVVKNEEQLIGNCLSSARKIADEIIVVDTGSTDRTIEIAKRFGARFISHSWDNLGKARNVAVSAASGDWILVLDGDEAIARGDLAKIKRLVRSRSVIGYQLAVRNYTHDYDLMWNWFPNDRIYRKEEKFSACPGWMKTQPLRLFRNFSDIQYGVSGSDHASPISALRQHSGRIEKRDDVVIHHFQYLKGGARFISIKQRFWLKGEMLQIKEAPHEPYPYLNVAKTLFAEKRDREAVKYLSEALILHDTFHEAYQLWGMIDFENGRLKAASKRLKKAIQIDANSADAWAILGMVLVEDGKPHQGMRALNTAIQLRPHHLLAHNSLGVLYEDLGMFKEARKQYQTAIKLNPRFLSAKANLARLTNAGEKRKNSRVRAKA
jgi:glycosyltransferase involved in cell wall biosynthesis